MAEEKFNLPNSSFPELEKIIKGYSHLGEGCNLTALAKLLGTNKTVVSPNNPFLAQVGIVGGGRDKKPTPLGSKLGRALDHKQETDIEAAWQEVVKGSEFLSGLITTARLKGGLSENDLSAHIVYVSGEKNSSRSRTGAKTIIDILKQSGLFTEENGNLQVAAPKTEPEELASPQAPSAPAQEVQPQLETTPQQAQPPIVNLPALGNLPQININIQLQLPETENTTVYENLFKALRENLLEKSADDSNS